MHTVALWRQKPLTLSVWENTVIRAIFMLAVSDRRADCHLITKYIIITRHYHPDLRTRKHSPAAAKVNRPCGTGRRSHCTLVNIPENKNLLSFDSGILRY